MGHLHASISSAVLIFNLLILYLDFLGGVFFVLLSLVVVVFLFFVFCLAFFHFPFLSKKIFRQYHLSVTQFGSRSVAFWVQILCTDYQKMQADN